MLVAISIPIFSSQLEKARESVDLSNVRAAYAEVMSAALTNDTNPDSDTGVTYTSTSKEWKKEVDLKQAKADWQTDTTGMELGGVKFADWNGTPSANGKGTVTYTEADGVTISFS